MVAMMFITACAPPAEASKDDRVGAGVKAINYSGKEIEFIAVERPGEPDSGGGGESLNPYSSGGTVCCFGIPKKWHPELKVMVKYRFYPESEVRKHLVSVPPYAAGETGDIWLLVYEDESVEAVVSDYLPTRPEWPGKIKGYPVASREYQLKIWTRKVADTENSVNMYKQNIKEFSKKTILEQWEYDLEYDKGRSEKKLHSFSGPDDPKYVQHLKDNNEQGLKFYSTRLDWLLKNKP